MAHLPQAGYEQIPGLLSAASVRRLREEADRLVHEQGQPAHGVRNLLAVSPLICDVAESARIQDVLADHLEAPFHCVRGILFDKTSEQNWQVTWHQDLSIAVAARHELAGFGPWSVKAQVPHVQPPAGLLAQMVTLRLHLDPTNQRNGALRVLPGTHRHGRLDAEAIAHWRTAQPEVRCDAEPGDGLLMRPLLLHASGKGSSPTRRRVIHLEYAPDTLLPSPLAWYR